MVGGCEFKIPSTVSEELDSIPAIQVATHGEAVSPTLPTVNPNKRSDTVLSSSGTLNSSTGPTDSCADEGVIDAILPTISLTHLILDNFCFAVSSITLTLFIVSFAVAWFTVLRDARLMKDQARSSTDGVSILGRGIQLDRDTCTLSTSWKVVVCGVRTTSEAPSQDDARVPTNCEPFDKALDVYFNDPSKPILSFTPHTKLTGQQLGVLNPPEFTTEHRFNKRGKWNPTEDLMVLFEYYSFHAFTFAIDPTTNTSVHITTFDVLDVLGDFIIHSHDAADTSTFTYESEDGLVSVEVESRVLWGEIKRSVIAKAFAICLFLGNWAMTVGSVYATALVASDKLEGNNIVAALPFSALLAIPTIRSLCGSSLLGISIDTVGLFVQIATIGLCCLTLLRVLTRCRSLRPTESSV